MEFYESVEFRCGLFDRDDDVDAAGEKNQGKEAETYNDLSLHY
jgi:hypothetical protein